MGAPLRLQTVDIPISLLDQTPPDTAGPIGRLKSLVNAQVTKYLGATATPGVATGARVKIEQREAFRALTTTVRSNVDGSVITPPWGPAELIDSLDDQLVAICDSIPRVKSGSSFTGYPGSRVVTRKLQQSILHTSNGVSQVPDGVWLSGVTCSTWVAAGAVFVGFKADNGAWVIPPKSIASPGTMPKVVSDGVNFWVVFVGGTTVNVQAYDTNGVLLGSSTIGTIPDVTSTPFDIIAASPGVLFAVESSSHVKFASATISGSTVTVTTNTDASTACSGPLGWQVNKSGDGLAYLAAANGVGLATYRVAALAQTKTYALPSVPSAPDVLGGYVDASFTSFVMAGFLATAQTVGPKFDPRSRKTVVYSCTSGGAAATVKTEYSVLPVSRAFQMDDDWYAVTYYQGGPGISQAGSTIPVTWTNGDQMKGTAVQDLTFGPSSLQYGFNVTIPRSPGTGTSNPDAVGVSGGTTTYSFFTPPGVVMALGQTFASLIYNGGSVTIGGASHGGNNATFAITSITLNYASNFIQIQAATTTQVTETFGAGVTSIITSPTALNSTWNLSDRTVVPDQAWVGENLFTTGTSQAANSGAFLITAVNGPDVTLAPPGSVDMQPEVIPNPVQSTAAIQLQLSDSSTAYEFFIQSVTFNQALVGATLSVSGSGLSEDDTVYQIITVIDSHHVIATPLNGSSNQRNRRFPSTVSINISFPTNATESLQPTWFITPLSIATQHTVGRFEYGLAYADWKFDGASVGPTDLYPCSLSSVTSTLAGLKVLLPYRAESFSAGVTSPTGNPVDTFFSTVGVKAFTLNNAPGQSLAVGGELIIPGPQASEFTASGFAEQGINLGPETPFIVSQTNDGSITLGLTPGTAYEYRVVFEATDEDGDRIYTIPSPALKVNLATTNNTITLGGNILQPTQRIVTISIYRTSLAGGSTTVQHYKITNDTDPNGAGFTFPDATTWNFKDQRPDVEVLVSEVLYTDKGFLPRYPCPAFIQGVGTWRNRTWVVGYDGAIWMSGEKTEGDAVWFHPAFRYILPTDDEPTCLASMDDYMIILGTATDWYIPSVVFPDATGNNGQLPAPVQLPFANGGTGFAVTTRDGVLYSSTAGGVWVISRNLANGWLSQPIQVSLGLGVITGMTVDKNQRVLISIGGENAWVWDTVPGAWYQWNIPSNSTCVAEWQGNFVYLDGLRVMQHTPGNYADNVGGSDIAIPPSWSLAPVHLMGSVRGYGRCWALQVQGEYLGPHLMGLTLGYGDEVDYQPPTVFPPTLANPSLSYLYEWNPQEEEASQFELSFAVTFPNGVAGNSATWELISFDVGVDQGIARLTTAKRISST